MDEHQEEMDQGMEQVEGSGAEGETKGKRTKRSKEELIAAIEKKIAAENERHSKMIGKLEAQKKDLLKPHLTKKAKYDLVIKKASKQTSPEELAEMLGLNAAELFS